MTGKLALIGEVDHGKHLEIHEEVEMKRCLSGPMDSAKTLKL